MSYRSPPGVDSMTSHRIRIRDWKINISISGSGNSAVQVSAAGSWCIGRRRGQRCGQQRWSFCHCTQ